MDLSCWILWERADWATSYNAMFAGREDAASWRVTNLEDFLPQMIPEVGVLLTTIISVQHNRHLDRVVKCASMHSARLESLLE